MANKTLHSAKTQKKDEFYTQIKDIEDELKHYRDQFRGKVVYCNCDDPFESNFFRYFVLNFKLLGLKSLITTSYKPSPIANTQLGLFGDDKTIIPAKGRPKVTANKFVINEVGDINGDGAFNLNDIAEMLKANKHNEWAPLEGDGDFRSEECVELLKQSDIVVTNPPFSLFREFIEQIVSNKKKYLIIANKNSVKYNFVFKLIQNDELWLGYRNINSDMWLRVPDGEKYEKIIDGVKLKHIMACWLTNLENTKHHEKFEMYKKYSNEQYPKYDNYDAIEVPKVADIPMDFEGKMGVPITFLDKYNPDQFELIGIFDDKREKSEAFIQGTPTYVDEQHRKYVGPVLNGKALYTRILIKRKATK